MKIRPFQFSLATLFILFTAIIVLISLLFSFFGRPARLGRSRAETDWAAHTAVIYCNYMKIYTVHGQNEITRKYDPNTGLEFRYTSFASDSYRQSYNNRIRELLDKYGVPSWSAKEAIPSDAELIAMIDSPLMEEVKNIPCIITPHITIMAKFRNGQRSVSINTSNGVLGCPHLDKSLFLARDPKLPKTIFIRGGQCWVIAYSEDGRHLADVLNESKIPPASAPRVGSQNNEQGK
jgi:hypothetical protein